MDEGKIFKKKLDTIATEMRELELLYERYFSGEERRAPLKQRAELEGKLRTLSTRRIIKTDLRFRFETLSARYHTYATQWNRIQRLMDEGKYQRHLDRLPPKNAGKEKIPASSAGDDLYACLVQAHRDGSITAALPERNRFEAYLEQQKSQIRDKYGMQDIEFRLVIEDGKPKLRARAK